MSYNWSSPNSQISINRDTGEITIDRLTAGNKFQVTCVSRTNNSIRQTVEVTTLLPQVVISVPKKSFPDTESVPVTYEFRFGDNVVAAGNQKDIIERLLTENNGLQWDSAIRSFMTGNMFRASAGQHTIQASTIYGNTNAIVVDVIATFIKPTSLVVNGVRDVIAGQQLHLTAEVNSNASNRNITWPGVAPAGTFTARTVGLVSFWVAAEGDPNVKKEVKFNVLPPAMSIGGSITLGVASPLVLNFEPDSSILDKNVQWSAAYKSGSGDISWSGNAITATGTGTLQVTARTAYGTVERDIEVGDTFVDMTISGYNQPTAKLEGGKFEYKYVATTNPSNYPTGGIMWSVEVEEGGSWKPAPTDQATIDSTGNFRALVTGKYRIKAYPKNKPAVIKYSSVVEVIRKTIFVAFKFVRTSETVVTQHMQAIMDNFGNNMPVYEDEPIDEGLFNKFWKSAVDAQDTNIRRDLQHFAPTSMFILNRNVGGDGGIVNDTQDYNSPDWQGESNKTIGRQEPESVGKYIEILFTNKTRDINVWYDEHQTLGIEVEVLEN